MSIVRIKNPTTGLWEVLEVGAVTGRASTDIYGVVKYGDGLTLNGVNQLVPDGDLVYFGPQPPEEDFYNLWYDTDEENVEDFFQLEGYHPDWNCTDVNSSQYILNKPKYEETLSDLNSRINGIRKDMGLLKDLQVEASTLVDSDNALNQRAAAVENKASDLEDSLQKLIHIGTTQPSNKAIIWLDLSDEED